MAPPAAALYQALILDHSRHPRHFGPLPDASHRAQRDNPFCGDDITVALALADDRIATIRFEGAGCAIALASASLMAETLTGRTRAATLDLAARFARLIAGEPPPPEGDLGPLVAFAEVSRFPVRIDCARLPWLALLAALGEPRVP